MGDWANFAWFVITATVAVSLIVLAVDKVKRAGVDRSAALASVGLHAVRKGRFAAPNIAELCNAFPKLRQEGVFGQVRDRRDDMILFDWVTSVSSISYHMPCAIGEIDAMCPELAISRGSSVRDASTDRPAKIRFEWGDFDSKIEVRCDDSRFAHALVDQRMMRWLHNLPRGAGIEVSGHLVLAYGSPLGRADLVVDQLEEFQARVPQVLHSLFPG